MAGALDAKGPVEPFGTQRWCGPTPGANPPLPGSSEGLHPGRTHPPRGSSRRILLIDDQATNLDSLRLILVLQGYAVDCVRSGVEGLRRALNGDSDFIILDLHMPDLPGWDVLERFRATGHQTPIVVITGQYLGEEHERRARALGVSAFLHKPIFDDDLVPAVRAAMDATTPPVFEDDAAVQPPPAPSSGSFERVPDADDIRVDGRCPPGANQLLIKLLPGLYRRTQRAFPAASPQLVVDAVHDAVMEQLTRRGPDRELSHIALVSRLAGAAWRNLDNAVVSEWRRRQREQLFAVEASKGLFGEAIDSERVAARRATLMALAEHESERHAIEAWLADAGFDEIARALGLGHLPVDEQWREVKRFKDRIKKRARRHGWRRRGD